MVALQHGLAALTSLPRCVRTLKQTFFGLLRQGGAGGLTSGLLHELAVYQIKRSVRFQINNRLNQLRPMTWVQVQLQDVLDEPFAYYILLRVVCRCSVRHQGLRR